jgi:hypothetical protein
MIYGLLDRVFFTDTEYSCFFCVFSFELYAGLPIALTIVHCDGTPILSLHTISDSSTLSEAKRE